MKWAVIVAAGLLVSCSYTAGDAAEAAVRENPSYAPVIKVLQRVTGDPAQLRELVGFFEMMCPNRPGFQILGHWQPQKLQYEVHRQTGALLSDDQAAALSDAFDAACPPREPAV